MRFMSVTLSLLMANYSSYYFLRTTHMKIENRMIMDSFCFLLNDH